MLRSEAWQGPSHFLCPLSSPALMATQPTTSLSQQLHQYVKEDSGKGPQWRATLGSSYSSSCLSL